MQQNLSEIRPGTRHLMRTVLTHPDHVPASVNCEREQPAFGIEADGEACRAECEDLPQLCAGECVIADPDTQYGAGI